MRSRHFTLCLATLSLAAGSASADRIDLNTELVKRLAKAGKLAPLYQQKTGRPMPQGIGVQAIFTGQVGGAGLQISAPGMIASAPLVLQEEDVSNCNTEPLVDTLQIDSSASNSTSFLNSDQFETAQELSVTVGYTSPFGASASATATAKQSQVTLNSKGGGDSTTVSWKYSPQITVAAQKMVTTQFVVTQEKLDNLPYVANFVLSGPVKLVYSAGAAGFTWVPRRGSALPTDPYKPFQLGKQWDYPVYACRVVKDNVTYIGKTHGDVCYLGVPNPPGIPFALPGFTSATYDFLVGDAKAVALGDPFTKQAFDADGKGLQVCVGDIGGGLLLPGYVSKDGQCISNFDQHSRATRNYKVLLDPHVGGVEIDTTVDSQLSPQDRTFNLRGLFSGVQAVKGNVRVSAPRPASDCGVVEASAMGMSVTPNLKGATANAMAKPALHPAKVKRVKPGPPLPESQALVAVPPSK